MKNSVDNCSIIELNKINSFNGSLCILNNNFEIPFEIKRIFYIYDIPSGESRGAHAHKLCHQLLVAATGSFDVLLDDGKVQKTINLNRPNFGLYIPPGIWASELNFSGGSVCLVITSQLFLESDYIRDYDEFLNFKLNDK